MNNMLVKIVLLLLIGTMVQIADAQDVFIVLDSSDMKGMLENIKYIESFGGKATHRFPPNTIIGDVPIDNISKIKENIHIVRIDTGIVDASAVSVYGKTVQIASNVWNNNYIGLAEKNGLVSTDTSTIKPIGNDTLIAPKNLAKSKLPLPIIPSGAGFYDTSEYMIGDIVVGIIFLESNGIIDPNSEDWTSTEESNVVSEIQAGLNWWKARESSTKLTFTYDIHYKVPTRYEPIIRSGYTGSPSGQSLWIADAMTNIGYVRYPSYFDNVRDYDNAIRKSFNTDWTYTIFVVDSSNDADGMFADESIAYAYFGGPFVVMTYKNDGYGIANMDAVIAHETGHIFYALDQYNDAQQPCTKTSGYLNIENQNSEYGSCLSNVASIMRGKTAPYTSGEIDIYAKGQIGWKDTDADNILDIIDFLPATTLNDYYPDPTSDSTPTYTGRATTTDTYPNGNPYGSKNRITINKIVKVIYRVDNGDWTTATPVDGSFDSAIEDFTFTTSQLSGGIHTISVGSTNTAGHWTYDSDTVDIIVPTLSARRTVDNAILTAGGETVITVVIQNDDIARALSLKESVPSGWGLTRISDDTDSFKADTNEWVWLSVASNTIKTVKYKLTVPSGTEPGIYKVNGYIEIVGSTASVDGDNTISVEQGDILSYYRGLGLYPNIVETSDLLKAADDWTNDIIPPGFSISITTGQLLTFADEWRNS